MSTCNISEVDAIVHAHHADPFSFLGMHEADDGMAVRVFRPDAASVTVIDQHDTSATWQAGKVDRAGLFEAVIPDRASHFGYLLRIVRHDGTVSEERDPFSYGRILGALDVYLFGEGNHLDLHHKLGAQLTEVGGAKGVAFSVWAPDAQRISVVGDFNQWDGRVHPMRKLYGSGIWEIFIPGIIEGAHYKFEVRTCEGSIVLKSDPMGFYGQHGLQTASLVFDLHRYAWDDSEWMERRKQATHHKSPICVYEVHLGSWARIPAEGNRSLSYLELADRLIPYVKKLGYTHIELLPVAEHPFDGSWGYQITGYFAPTSRFGNPDEFRHFVDRCHQEGIGVILDWVPGHFPKDAHGLAKFDGTCLYEHADPKQGEQRDWGTLIFNYGRNEVRNFLISNAIFWFEQYHIDGLRVDAVASMLYLDYSREAGEWIPNCFGGRENLEAISFLKRMNEVCYGKFPGIMTIAEESTAWPAVSRPIYLGGLGFGFKWNMGWMNDSLRYMSKDPVYRRHHQGDMTFSLLYAFHEHFMLVLSHDEVVHGKGSLIGKMPGDRWQQFANLRMFYAWMYAHPGKKLLFQGGEFGQVAEWDHTRSLDWHLLQYPEHEGLSRLVQDLNQLYRSEPALYELDDTHEGFEWIDFHDADGSIFSFVRRDSRGATLLFVINATPVARKHYRVGVPVPGFYLEVLNTDSETYAGSNFGNFGGLQAEETAWQGRNHSLGLNLPPLATICFKLSRS